MSVLCIQITLQYGVVLQQILFVVFFFRAEHFSRAPEVFHHRFALLQSPSAVHHSRFTSTTVFMQDGAPPHIARQVTALLRAHFGGFPTAWPPRSPD